MLAVVSDWVRHLVIIVVLAGFIEMILPKGDMRRYVQMVVGIFIIMAILNPTLLLLRQRQLWGAPSFDQGIIGQTELSGVLRESQAVSTQIQDQALQHYRLQLEEQIRVLLSSVEGVGGLRAKVNIVDNPSLDDYGKLVGISLWVDYGMSEESAVSMIPEVKLGPVREEEDYSRPGGDYLPPEAEAEIKGILTTFYNLPPEAVAIWVGEKRGEGRDNSGAIG